MIFHTIYAIQNTLSVFNDAPDVFVQLLVMLLRNCFFPIVCAKYDVIQNLSITVHSFLFWVTRKRVVVLLVALNHRVKTRRYSQATPTECFVLPVFITGIKYRIRLRCESFLLVNTQSPIRTACK